MPAKTIKGKGAKKGGKEDDEAYAPKSPKPKAKSQSDHPEIKRPTSSYFIFMKEKREQIKADNPDLNTANLAKKMAEEWKSLDAETKKKWEDLAQVDKDRYEKEKEAAGIHKKPEYTGPKKPLTAFFIYQGEQRSKIKELHPTLSNVDVIRKMSEEWKELKEDEKKKYEDMAKKDKQRYEAEVKGASKEAADSGSEKAENEKDDKDEKDEKDEKDDKEDKDDEEEEEEEKPKAKTIKKKK